MPRERIVVHAASTPAAVAVEAALRHPGKTGIVAVIGLYKETRLPRPPAAAPLREPGFPGEQDQTIPPEMARRLLEKTFGEEALQPPRGLWHVFEGEPHALARDESPAAIHATILRLLGLI